VPSKQSRQSQMITQFLPNVIEEQLFVEYPFAYNVDEICEIYTKFKALQNENVYSIQIGTTIRAFAIVSKITAVCYIIDEKQTTIHPLSNLVITHKLSTKAFVKTLYNISTSTQTTVTKIQSRKKKLIKELCAFDKSNTIDAQFANVGILYVSTTDTDCITLALESKYKLKNTTGGFKSFLSDMDISADIDPDNKFDDTFNGMRVKWHVGPLMSKQSIRQHIGNANFVIICKDGPQPLQLDMLEALGKVVSYCLVIEPVCSVIEPVCSVIEPVCSVIEPVCSVIEPVCSVIEPVCSVEAKALTETFKVPTLEHQRHFYRMSFIQKTRNVINPIIPIAHLFSNTPRNNIKDFILTKIHNSVVRTKTSSPMYTYPRSACMKELWNTYGNK